MPSYGITRDSHYVPRAMLRRWSSDGTHVFAYRTLVSTPRVPEWQPKAIRGLCFHRDLYTVFADGREVDDFEHWLARDFEQPGLESVDNLIRGARLKPNDWRRMARFLAAQDIRTPLSFIELVRGWDKELPEILDRVLKESVRRLEEASGKHVPEDRSHEPSLFSGLFKVTVEPVSDPGSDEALLRVSVPIGRQMWIVTMRHLLTGIADVLCNHRWSVAEPADDLEWPLTDHPVLKLNYHAQGQYDFGGGWGRRGSEIMMPVSPKHLLYVKVGTKAANRFVLSREHTQLAQRLLVERAHRWVFATRPFDWVAGARPRLIDPERVKEEEEAWKDWHHDQLQAEMES